MDNAVRMVHFKAWGFPTSWHIPATVAEEPVEVRVDGQAEAFPGEFEQVNKNAWTIACEIGKTTEYKDVLVVSVIEEKQQKGKRVFSIYIGEQVGEHMHEMTRGFIMFD